MGSASGASRHLPALSEAGWFAEPAACAELKNAGPIPGKDRRARGASHTDAADAPGMDALLVRRCMPAPTVPVTAGRRIQIS